jgi:lipoyl(octanoyl) transferase
VLQALTLTPKLEGPGLLVEDWGLAPFDVVYERQLELVSRRKRSESLDRLLMGEHLDIYTFGRRSVPSTSDAILPTALVERGGEATFHNPGQLVCYPILKLGEFERDLHKYLRRLEQVLIDVLSDFGLKAERRPGATGVWIVGKEKKIASIGVAVSSWVTYHGTALNVRNDLSGFSKIHPCGFSSEVMTSMAQELADACPSLEQVKESYLRHFSRVFARKPN